MIHFVDKLKFHHCAVESPGAASAIFGAVSFLFGGIVSPLVGIGEIIHTSSILIIACAAICLALSIVCVRRDHNVKAL